MTRLPAIISVVGAMFAALLISGMACVIILTLMVAVGGATPGTVPEGVAQLWPVWGLGGPAAGLYVSREDWLKK